MSHTHTMKDTDPSFFIDADLRTIESTSEDPVTLVKGDHNSEIFTFEMDRYIDEHDLKQCNKVEVHYINIDTNSSKNKSYGIYTVTDLAVDPSDSNSISFTWKVPITATTYAGALSFVVRFECTEGEEILYAWNTTPCNEVSVLDSIYNTDFIEEEYTDVIGEWYNEILSAKNQAIDEIGKSGGIVVSRTEPESDDVNVWVDNSEEEVVMLLEASDCVKMANSIKGNASGEVIRLDDVSPLEHGVKAKVGKNLFDYTKIENTLTYQKFIIAVEPGKAYTVSSNIPQSSAAEIYFNGDFTTENGVWNGCPKTFTATSNEMYIAFQYIDNLQLVMDGACYVQFEEGSTATAYEPYVDPTTVTVTGCGKNLVPVYKDLKTTTVKGITFTVNDDMSITCNGTATANATFNITPNYKLPVGRYMLRGCPSNGSESVRLQTNKIVNGTANTGAIDIGTGCALPVTEDCALYTYLVVLSGQSVSNFTFKPMIQLEGDSDTTYEIPNVKTYTPSSDGSVVIDSVSPNMSVFTDTAGVTIELEYNKDINKVLANLPSGGGSGGGANITVDSQLSTTSTNPVQNKVVAEAINNINKNVADLENKENKVTIIDSAATDDQYPSAKAVYDAILALDAPTYETRIIKNFSNDKTISECVNNYLSGVTSAWVSDVAFVEDGTLTKITLVSGSPDNSIGTEKTLKVIIVSSDLICRSVTEASYIATERRTSFDISVNVQVKAGDCIGFIMSENGQFMYSNGTAESNLSITNASNIFVGNVVNYTKTFADTDIPFVCEYLVEVTGEEVVNNKKVWEGKKWACVGDSITMPNSPHNTTPYYNIIAENTGIEIFNMGVTSTGYKQREAQNEAFYQRILSIDADCDVITILGSGNDLGKGFDLGTAIDTGTETICGCINTTLDNLYSVITSANVGIITPYPWQSYPPNTDNTMSKYVDKLIEIAKLRGIPCLDLYHCSGLRPWDEVARAEQFSSIWTEGGDGVHVNDFGNTLIAPKIKAFLSTMLLD